MTPEQRLAQLVAALEQAGLAFLVMGGHAVRYYGVQRNTVDFDFVIQIASTHELRDRLAQSELLRGAREGPSWRPNDFARFETGKLSDGREEWLEFWLRNHLLPDFSELISRHEKGLYGDTLIPFVSLGDLLRSKETERESDWQDISLLEEVQDARNLAAATTTAATVEAFLAQLRSQRGLERGLTMKLFDDAAVVRPRSQNASTQSPLRFSLPWRRGSILLRR